MPWNYPLYAFVTLCKSCHDNRHKYLITKHASHDDAETWIIFSDIEQQMIEEEIELSYERIDELTERDAVWEANGRYYCRTDEEGHARFFDEDGNEL